MWEAVFGVDRQSVSELVARLLGGVMLRTSDSQLLVEGLIPGHDTAWLFFRDE